MLLEGSMRCKILKFCHYLIDAACDHKIFLELNYSKMSSMCLFPWLDYGIDIVDFENFDFLVGQPIFYHFERA